jgi:hypothetical protein
MPCCRRQSARAARVGMAKVLPMICRSSEETTTRVETHEKRTCGNFEEWGNDVGQVPGHREVHENAKRDVREQGVQELNRGRATFGLSVFRQFGNPDEFLAGGGKALRATPWLSWNIVTPSGALTETLRPVQYSCLAAELRPEDRASPQQGAERVLGLTLSRETDRFTTGCGVASSSLNQ